jgi:hypothetical protein
MASGEIDITPGRVLSAEELVDNAKLNDLGVPIARVKAAAVTAREIADGSITSDKLDVDLEAQIGLADGSVTTAKIVDDAVTAAKIADDLITAQVAIVTLDALDLLLVWDASASGYRKLTYGNLFAQVEDELDLPAAILTGTVTVDPPNISSNGLHSFTITVTGAVTTNTPSVSLGFSMDIFSLGITHGARVSAANTVTVTYFNGLPSSVNLPSHTVRATVFQY